MSKITLTDLVNLTNQTTAVNAINNNNAVLTTAMDNTLSRDGTQPNTMGATLDMNSNQIINLPQPNTVNSPLRLGDVVNPILPPPALLSGNNIYTGNNSFTGANTFSNSGNSFTGGTFASPVISGTPTGTTTKFIADGANIINAADYGVGTGVADNSVPLNALINSFIYPNVAGVINLPAGTLNFTNPINMNNKNNVILIGKGGVSAGGIFGTFLNFTLSGSGGAILMNGAIRCEIRDCFIVNATVAFTGDLIQCNNLSNDPGFCGVYNCTFDDVGRSCNGINLDKCENFYVHKCLFAFLNTAIKGLITSSGQIYSIGTTIRECEFTGGNAGLGYIINPGQNWLIDSCIFEPGLTGQACGITTTSSTFAFKTLNIINCWMGDVTIGSCIWINIQGNTLVIEGCSLSTLSGLTNTNGIELTNVTNAVIKGNYFDGFTVCISFGGTCSKIDVFPNTYVNTVSAFSNIANIVGGVTPGYVYLPNGMIMQWGSAVVVTGTPLLVTFPIQFTSGGPFSVQTTLNTPVSNANTVCVTSVITNQMTLNVAGTAGSSGVYWLAIGTAAP